MEDVNECRKEVAYNKKGSTQLMQKHLQLKHVGPDSNLPNQYKILADFKKVKAGHVVSSQSYCLFS